MQLIGHNRQHVVNIKQQQQQQQQLLYVHMSQPVCDTISDQKAQNNCEATAKKSPTVAQQQQQQQHTFWGSWRRAAPWNVSKINWQKSSDNNNDGVG